ncbi:hypothetical protein Hanom_Chr06g00505691 [Helianthus anomalus]
MQTEEDLEEGEIQRVPTGKKVSGDDGGNESCGPVFEAADNQKSPNDRDASGEDLHGEYERTFGFPNKNHDEDVSVAADMGNNSGTHANQETPLDVGPLGSTNTPGPYPPPPLGKRPRDLRSPPSIGSIQGPQTRACHGDSNINSGPFDLNIPVRPRCSSSSSAGLFQHESHHEDRGPPEYRGSGSAGPRPPGSSGSVEIDPVAKEVEATSNESH